MDDQRRLIIIKEIQSWKENKLLPPQYCDFLLALYSEGDNEKLVAATIESSNEVQISLLQVFVLASNLFVIPLAIAFLYLTNLSVGKQILVLVIFLFLSIGYYIVTIKQLSVKKIYPLIILLMNIYVISILFVTQWVQVPFLTYSVAIVQLLCWMILGVRMRYRSLIYLALFTLFLSLVAIWI